MDRYPVKTMDRYQGRQDRFPVYGCQRADKYLYLTQEICLRVSKNEHLEGKHVPKHYTLQANIYPTLDSETRLIS
jgi:hypothetical protein